MGGGGGDQPRVLETKGAGGEGTPRIRLGRFRRPSIKVRLSFHCSRGAHFAVLWDIDNGDTPNKSAGLQNLRVMIVTTVNEEIPDNHEL